MTVGIDYYVEIWTNAQASIWARHQVKRNKERLEGIKILAKQNGVYEEVEAAAKKRLDISIFNPGKPENLGKLFEDDLQLPDPVDEPERLPKLF